MSNDAEFVNRFYEAQRKSSYHRTLTPVQAVEEWEGLLEQVHDGEYWWKAHAPRYGGPELAQDYLEQHGIQIEVRDNR